MLHIKWNFIILASALFVSNAHAQLGLPKLPGVSNGSAPSVQSSDFLATFLEARIEMNTAELRLAEALGLDEEATRLRAEADRLAQGSVTTQQARESVTTSREAQAAMTEKINSGAELDAASKAKLAEALPPLAIGTFLTTKLPDQASQYANQLQAEADSAGMMQKASAARRAAAAARLAGDMPGFVSTTLNNYRTIINFSRENDVPIPDNATDVL